jgi:hypothetical protein
MVVFRIPTVFLLFCFALQVSIVCPFSPCGQFTGILPRVIGKRSGSTTLCASSKEGFVGSGDVGSGDRSAGVKEIEDLVRAGRLRVWRKSEAPVEALEGGGARGAGHSKETSNSHMEPDTIYVLGTSHISEESAKLVQKVVSYMSHAHISLSLSLDGLSTTFHFLCNTWMFMSLPGRIYMYRYSACLRKKKHVADNYFGDGQLPQNILSTCSVHHAVVLLTLKRVSFTDRHRASRQRRC